MYFKGLARTLRQMNNECQMRTRQLGGGERDQSVDAQIHSKISSRLSRSHRGKTEGQRIGRL